MCAVVAVLQVAGPVLAGRHQPDARPLDAIGYMLLVGGAVALLLRRQRPVVVLALTFATTLSYELLGYPGGPIWTPLIVAFGTALVLGHRLATYASLPLGYVAFLYLANSVNDRPLPSAWVAIGIAAWMLLLPAASELVRNRRAYLRESRRRLREEHRLREEAARRQSSEQRLEIARELHDVLAHSISLINVQAGVALELIEQRPDQVRPALTAIKQASREALLEVQSMLGTLRSPDELAPRSPVSRLAKLDNLARGARGTGLDVRIQVDGEPLSLTAEVDQAAFRIVQEGLTNVVRHAQAKTVTIRLFYGPQQLTVEVHDDGQGGSARPTTAGGNGILGMRERAEALGGGLDAGPKRDGGFKLHAWLPLTGRPGGASE